ncbi:SnoaL-like domain-containing protein [Kribbella sandramycini]|uniref:Putative ester cyclase n=1 Tax=Kribbella sandramycini TaxID=60450 RepID=A0A7Y4L0I3_9ACTN|nr:ester cyclase [Kribbella sandramycini]MBB6565790.1 putative ester cyclase [Kribbella sandramycini]NOL42054.1 SnoaL-like domain-containing protein [Kribbella sandramycini]
MDTTTTADLAVRCIQIMADGEYADFARLVHPDAVNRERFAGPPECRGVGPESYYATALWLRAAFSELAFEVRHVVTEGELVVINTTMSGRHTAPFAVYTDDGAVKSVFPPTGKTFATERSHWLRVQEGQIVEHWANRDDLGQAEQLGWVPPTPGYLIRMARAKSRVKRGM